MTDLDTLIEVLRSADCHTIRVKPKSSVEGIMLVEGVIVVNVRALPNDGEANAAVVTLFKKLLRLKIEIVHGHQSSTKRIKVYSLKI